MVWEQSSQRAAVPDWQSGKFVKHLETCLDCLYPHTVLLSNLNPNPKQTVLLTSLALRILS